MFPMLHPNTILYRGLKTAIFLFLLFGFTLNLTACGSQTVWLAFDDESSLRQISIQGKTLAEILENAGYVLGDGDRVLVNGVKTDAGSEIILEAGDTIQVRRAYPMTVHDDGVNRTILTSARTVGQALWENQIIVSASDFISLPLETVIDQALEIEIRRSNLISIQVDGKQITSSASAQTVGDALAQAGVSLQNLDYSIPAEEETLPADGIIQVVRVSEEIQLVEEIIPYETEYVADAEMDLDQLKITQAGQAGLSMSRVRIRTENGKEVARETEESWIAQTPISQQTAYGTKITIQTTSTADGTIEYWRAVTVTANSYHDTGYKTASGKWPTYGMVAVSSDWYSYMKGTSIYVPEYGVAVVEDKCGACAGNMLIDVFIPTDQYVGWHKTLTIYFLTPVPASIKYVLP
ncbi:MAG: ubiquitin-like domain-containing protein [Anaerolineaceae bacterium]